MDSPREMPRLTPRELASLQGAAQHKTAKEVARDLEISESRVRELWDQVREKLGVATIRDAVRTMGVPYLIDPLHDHPPRSTRVADGGAHASPSLAFTDRNEGVLPGLEIDEPGVSKATEGPRKWGEIVAEVIGGVRPERLSDVPRLAIILIGVMVFGVAMMAVNALGALAYGVVVAVANLTP